MSMPRALSTWEATAVTNEAAIAAIAVAFTRHQYQRSR